MTQINPPQLDLLKGFLEHLMQQLPVGWNKCAGLELRPG